MSNPDPIPFRAAAVATVLLAAVLAAGTALGIFPLGPPD